MIDGRQGAADGRHLGHHLGPLDAQVAARHADAHHLLALHHGEQLKCGRLIDVVATYLPTGYLPTQDN